MTMVPAKITMPRGAKADAVQAQVERAMDAFNRAHLGSENERRIVLAAADEAGQFAGAAAAWIYWDCVYLENLWVEPSQRGRGIGTHLLQALEGEANRAACA